MRTNQRSFFFILFRRRVEFFVSSIPQSLPASSSAYYLYVKSMRETIRASEIHKLIHLPSRKLDLKPWPSQPRLDLPAEPRLLLLWGVTCEQPTVSSLNIMLRTL